MVQLIGDTTGQLVAPMCQSNTLMHSHDSTYWIKRQAKQHKKMVSALDQLYQEMKNRIDGLVTSELEEMGKEQRYYQKIKNTQKLIKAEYDNALKRYQFCQGENLQQVPEREPITI